VADRNTQPCENDAVCLAIWKDLPLCIAKRVFDTARAMTNDP
jgi:hypothetical protein